MPEIQFKLSSYKEKILLHMYKYGFFQTYNNTEATQKTCQWLEKNGYLIQFKHTLPKDDYRFRGKTELWLMLLTPKSADYVESNFYNILKSNSLYHLSPILTSGDIIKFIKRHDKYQVNKGLTFKVTETPRYDYLSLECIWGFGDIKFRCKAYEIKDSAILLRDNIGSPADEFQKRIPLIPKEYLNQYVFNEFTNNLEVAEIMGHLNAVDSFRNRLISLEDLGVDKLNDSDKLKKSVSNLLFK